MCEKMKQNVAPRKKIKRFAKIFLLNKVAMRFIDVCPFFRFSAHRETPDRKNATEKIFVEILEIPTNLSVFAMFMLLIAILVN